MAQGRQLRPPYYSFPDHCLCLGSRGLLDACRLFPHACWPKLTRAMTPCGAAGTSIFSGSK